MAHSKACFDFVFVRANYDNSKRGTFIFLLYMLTANTDDYLLYVHKDENVFGED